jgi:hypothetical protein
MRSEVQELLHDVQAVAVDPVALQVHADDGYLLLPGHGRQELARPEVR